MPRESEPECERPEARPREAATSSDEAEFLKEVADRFTELRTQLQELWAIKVAELKLSLWEKVFAVAAGILGLVFVAALLGVAVYFLVAGAAEGLSGAVGSRWLGSVLAGLAAVILVATGFLLAKRVLTRRAV